MNTVTKSLSLLALCCAGWVPAVAQQAAPPATGPATTAPAAPPTTAPAAPSAKAAHPTAQSEAGDPRADTSSAPAPGGSPSPSSAAAPSTGPAPAARASPGQKSATRTDRLDLGTATVTGEREQPKVMYVVPWKRSDIGDLAGKPMNSLVDEILAPVDRDVFKREVVYYHAVQADASQNGAPPKPGQQGEK
jgi:hypothetical protein